MLTDDVGRGLDPVDAFVGEHTAIIDEVALARRKLHQLLRWLHGLSGRQVTEQVAQDLGDIHLRKQLASVLLIDDERRGHTRLQINYFVYYGLFVYLGNIVGLKMQKAPRDEPAVPFSPTRNQ
ncbi:hypothetical protein D3C72_2135570 [compost metagenome]